MFSSVSDFIKIPPGVGATLKFKTRDGKEHVLLDVWNPEFETEDDGTKGDPNKQNQYLMCHWFPGEAFLRYWYLEIFSMMAEEQKKEYEERIKALEQELEEVRAPRGFWGRLAKVMEALKDGS